MSVGVTSVRFSEENSAAGAWWTCAASGCISLPLLLLRRLGWMQPQIPGTLGHALVLVDLLALAGGVIAWMYLVVGGIWHPIPQEYRDGITHLNLDPKEASPPPETSDSRHYSFKLLDLDADRTEEDRLVDSSQIEVRDEIEWGKMLLTTACVALSGVLAFGVAY